MISSQELVFAQVSFISLPELSVQGEGGGGLLLILDSSLDSGVDKRLPRDRSARFDVNGLEKKTVQLFLSRSILSTPSYLTPLEDHWGTPSTHQTHTPTIQSEPYMTYVAPLHFPLPYQSSGAVVVDIRPEAEYSKVWCYRGPFRSSDLFPGSPRIIPHLLPLLFILKQGKAHANLPFKISGPHSGLCQCALHAPDPRLDTMAGSQVGLTDSWTS